MAQIDGSPANWLPSCTSLIKIERQDGSVVTGTGFFYDFPLQEEEAKAPREFVGGLGRLVVEVGGIRQQVAPMLVTNKHVVNGEDFATVWITVAPKDALLDELGLPVGRRHLPVRIELGDAVVHHPNPDVDLCALPLALRFWQIEAAGDLKVVNSRLYAGHRVPAERKNALRHIESVAMIGYPNGLWDHVNNAPLVRRGTTATHPLVSYQGRPEFLIDMACFPGSSGSPVFLYQDGIYQESGVPHIGIKTALLGVLWGGPQFSADGKLEVRPVPNGLELAPVPVTRIPMNLGIVIHASELDQLVPGIQERHRKFAERQRASGAV
ncbi:MAG: trypsin-like peptidase domain-containing protein [Burkholderiaceae bacterium]|nr:trypsin-like peptidase domain-containing protein [Burkholderiaceae bacterium]